MQTRPSQSKPETGRNERNLASVRQMLRELGTVARNESAGLVRYLIEIACRGARDMLAGGRPVHPGERPG